MCGRILQYRDLAAYAAAFGLGPGASAPNVPERYNGAPTQDFLVIRRNPHTAQAELGALRWGFVPVWAKDISIAGKTINARAETVSVTPSYRGAWRAARRCIIPVDGFYEWQREGGEKQPWLISHRDGAPLGLAGLWEGWKDPQTGVWLRTFTILTCEASPFMSSLHHRMPVILQAPDYLRWLETDNASTLLRPYGGEDLVMRPVSRKVNSVRNEGAELIEPLPASGEGATA